MKKQPKKSLQKVQEALLKFGLECKVHELPTSTRTAAEAAQSIGCGIGQIVKSLIFKGTTTQSPILVLTSGSNRVDENKISAFAGETIEKATANFVRDHTGFAIGGVPPLGHCQPLKTFIDEDLLLYESLWAAAGTPHAVFQLTPQDLQTITQGQVVCCV